MSRARVNPRILSRVVIYAAHAVKAPRAAPLGLVSALVMRQRSNSRAVLWVLLGVIASGASAVVVAAEGDDEGEARGQLQERRARREAADRQRREDDQALAPPPVVSDISKQMGIEFVNSQIRSIQLAVASTRQHMTNQ